MRVTPGPWKASPGDGCWEVQMGEGLFAKVYGGNAATDAANARLIAAAPDLFEAAKRVIELPNDAAWDALRAAIVKATQG